MTKQVALEYVAKTRHSLLNGAGCRLQIRAPQRLSL